jgi:hypothetical protein
MMCAGEWQRGKCAPDLAAKWGLTVSTVENYSNEAKRLSRLMKAEYARLRLAKALNKGISVVETELDGEQALDAARALPQLVDKFAGLVGANSAQRHEITGANGGPVQLAALVAALPAEAQQLAMRAQQGDREAEAGVRQWLTAGRMRSLALEAPRLEGELREEVLDAWRALGRALGEQADRGEVLALAEGNDSETPPT